MSDHSHDNIPLTIKELESQLAWDVLQYIEHETGITRKGHNRDSSEVGQVKDVLHRIHGAATAHNPIACFHQTVLQINEESMRSAKLRLVRSLGEIVERAHATSGWVFLIRAEEENPATTKDRFFFPVAAYNAPELSIYRLVAEEGAGIVGRVAATGSSILTGDVLAQPVYGNPPRPLYMRDVPSTKAEVAVPIKDNQGMIIGVLNLEANYRNAFIEPQRIELQAATSILLLDLQVLSEVYSARHSAAFDPHSHGWKVTPILNRLCEGIALSLPTQHGNPSVGCAIWLLDEAKETIAAIGAARFDFEYLAQNALPLSASYIGEAITALKDGRDLGRWEHHQLIKDIAFARPEKAERMELRTIAVFPFAFSSDKAAVPVTKGKEFGALVIYGFDHDWGIRGISLSNVFSRLIGRTLAELLGRYLGDLCAIRRRAARLYFLGRITSDITASRNPLETVKQVFLHVLECHGCTVFVKPSQEELVLAATTGVTPNDRSTLRRQASYLLNPVALTIRLSPKGASKGEAVYVGLTNYLGQVAGSVIRKHDAVNIKERVKVAGSGEMVLFAPRNTLLESFAPGTGEHMRFLGVSITDKNNNVVGVVRMTRSGNALPFLALDEMLAKDLAIEAVNVFIQSATQLRDRESGGDMLTLLHRFQPSSSKMVKPSLAATIINSFGVGALQELGNAVKSVASFIQLVEKAEYAKVWEALSNKIPLFRGPAWSQNAGDIAKLIERIDYWTQCLRLDSATTLASGLLFRPTPSLCPSWAVFEAVLEDLNLLCYPLIEECPKPGDNPTVLSDIRIVGPWGPRDEDHFRIWCIQPCWSSERSDDYKTAAPRPLRLDSCGAYALLSDAPVSFANEHGPSEQWFHKVHPHSDWVKYGICVPLILDGPQVGERIKVILSVDFAEMIGDHVVTDKLMPAIQLAAYKIAWLLSRGFGMSEAVCSQYSRDRAMTDIVEYRWRFGRKKRVGGALFRVLRKYKRP